METITISVICSIVAAVISIATYNRNTNKDLKKNTEEGTYTKAKLDYISKGVDDIRLDIKAQDRKIEDINSRLIRVEESTKSAHKRLDTFEKEGV